MPENRMALARKLARQKRLCTVCLRTPAANKLTICATCNENAKARVRQWRARKAEETARRRVLASQEAAGDFARDRYAYPEALRQYEEALKSPASHAADEIRLSEKYASTLFYGREPEKAREWFERALEGHRKVGITAENAAAAGTLLLRLSRQYWLNASTLSALPLISEAIQLGAIARDEAFFARANLAMAHYLILLGRHAAAEPFFDRAGTVSPSDPPEMRAINLAQRGILHAAQGDRKRAYRSFDAAVDASLELPDGYQVTSVWDDYGIWAMALGDRKTAQLCRERALFVARERHIAWRIAYLSLRYADLLLELEQYQRARDLILDALTYDIETPCVAILTASVGTRLASVFDDAGLIQRCNYNRAIDYAFQSGEPGRIGPLVSAVVRMHIASGKKHEAVALFRRGLSAVLSADHAWDLLLDAATLGTKAERIRARSLLHSRALLPSGQVATAYLKWFDGGPERSQTSGPGRQRRREAPAQEFRTMLGDVSTLTKREGEVAELVLKGFTNREIARQLWISEHTVESHMTSIMNRLGIRSRHQLVDHLSLQPS